MPFGITPARGDWEYRRSTISTLAQSFFTKGDLVVLDHTRVASVYTSTYSGYFGVAMGSSINSLPAGFQLVAIPRAGCTAYIDLLTGEVASGLSLGQVGSVGTVSAVTGNQTSAFSRLQGSVFSSIWEIVGPVDSTNSRIEVAFLQQGMTFYSVSTTTLNN